MSGLRVDGGIKRFFSAFLFTVCSVSSLYAPRSRAVSLRRGMATGRGTSAARGAVFVMCWSSIVATAVNPYSKMCNKTYVEVIVGYNSSEGTLESELSLGRSYALLLAVDGSVSSVYPSLAVEDLTAELNFTLEKKPVLQQLTALGISDGARLIYSCRVDGRDCSMTCLLSPYSISFIGKSGFALDPNPGPEIISICSNATDTTSLMQRTGFYGRWSRICAGMRSSPAGSNETVGFRHEKDGVRVTCEFCSALPFRFGMWIQRPDRNVTVACPQRPDRKVCCSLTLDVGDVTDPRVLRCCVSSAWTPRRCAGLPTVREEMSLTPTPSPDDTGLVTERNETSPSPVSSGDGTHVAVAVALSLLLALGVVLGVVLYRKRLGSRSRCVYRSTATDG